MKNIKTIICIIIILIVAVPVGYRNIDLVKLQAEKTWSASGFKVVGYEGYQHELLHGGKVWYLVTRVDNDQIVYHGFLAKWGNEIHIYNLKAVNVTAQNK